MPPAVSPAPNTSRYTNRFRGEGLACVRSERLVFTGLDFDLGPGDATFLVGPNGSGKSSLLRLMAGLAPPAAGTMKWDDFAARADPERHFGRFHYVGHADAVKPYLSVAENLALWAGLRGGGADDVAAALARFGLDRLADFAGRLLSAGQRRRLGLARLVATPAALWLLDEPTVALDRESVGALYDVIAAHRAGGGMAVIATNVDMALDDAQTLDLARFAADGAGAAEVWLS
jgi:heme exporter protein A